MQTESEGEAEAARAAVLTPPLSLGAGGLAGELRPANLGQRVLSLFRNVRPGSDLSHFQVPALRCVACVRAPLPCPPPAYADSCVAQLNHLWNDTAAGDVQPAQVAAAAVRRGRVLRRRGPAGAVRARRRQPAAHVRRGGLEHLHHAAPHLRLRALQPGARGDAPRLHVRRPQRAPGAGLAPAARDGAARDGRARGGGAGVVPEPRAAVPRRQRGGRGAGRAGAAAAAPRRDVRRRVPGPRDPPAAVAGLRVGRRRPRLLRRVRARGHAQLPPQPPLLPRPRRRRRALRQGQGLPLRRARRHAVRGGRVLGPPGLAQGRRHRRGLRALRRTANHR
jgi:hypothetical protein